MDFFRKKKGDGKSKKGKKDKNESSSQKGSSPAFGLNVTVTNDSGPKGNKSYKETNVDRNNSGFQAQAVTPSVYAESPNSEVHGLARTPEPDEVVVLNNRVLSPNGVKAYKQFNEVLNKMDRALETEESEDDMDASSLGLALRSEPDIDMSPQARLQNGSSGTFQLSGVTADDRDVDDQVVPSKKVPIIHVTQPSADSMEQDSNVEAIALKSPIEWNDEDVVDWCKSRGLTYFAELFDGSNIDGTSLLDMDEDDLKTQSSLKNSCLEQPHPVTAKAEEVVDLELDDAEQRKHFLTELAVLRESLAAESGAATPTSNTQVETDVEIDHPVAKWTNEDILMWLEEVRLTRFLTVFRDYDVTGLQLMDLDLQMLDDLGITQVEDREQFLSRFYELLNDDSLAVREEQEVQIEPVQYDAVNAAPGEMTAAIEENDVESYRHNNTPADELVEDYAPTPVPAIEVPSPEPEERIEEIWSLIESGKSTSEHHSTDVSAEVTPRSTDYESNILSPEVDIDREIRNMEKTIAKLQSDLQGSEDTESQEHSSIVLKLSTAQTRLRSLHEQKSIMEESSDESKSQDATFEIHTSDLYQLMVDNPIDMVMVDIDSTSDGTPGFDVLEDEDHGGLVVTSSQSGLSLQPGDRLLEVNGYNISSSPLSIFEQFMSTHPPPLKLVVIRPKHGKDDDKEEELSDLKDDLSLVLRDLEVAVAENKELKNENQQLKSSLRDLQDEKSQHAMQVQMLQEQVEASETRWKDLRNSLVKMKNDQFDLETAFGPFSQWNPQTGTKADLDEALQTVNVLQKTLEEKHTALSNTKKEKNEYKKRLNQILNDSTSSDLNYEILDDKQPIWESMQSRSKTEVLQALKDNVLENERQKVCFDQLLAVVMKRAPALLQKVDVLNAIKFDDVKNRPEFQC